MIFGDAFELSIIGLIKSGLTIMGTFLKYKYYFASHLFNFYAITLYLLQIFQKYFVKNQVNKSAPSEFISPNCGLQYCTCGLLGYKVYEGASLLN